MDLKCLAYLNTREVNKNYGQKEKERRRKGHQRSDCRDPRGFPIFFIGIKFNRDCNIFIYKNPRKIIFGKALFGKKSNLEVARSSAFGNSFFLGIVGVVLSVPLFNTFVIQAFFMGTFYMLLFIGFFIINCAGFYSDFMAEVIPTMTWLTDYPLYVLTRISYKKKSRIVVRNIYTDKLSLRIPAFMFLDYKLTGDWADYKRIAIKRFWYSWNFEIILNKIAKEGSMILKFK